MMNLVLESGADDMKTEDDMYEIYTTPESFETVKQALEAKSVKMEEAEIQLIPENTVKVDGKDAEHVLKLMEALEEHEDVQHVYANFDIDEKVLASLNV
jgi:transcriptional/translational regulatory protein YebC/TACO1